MILNLLVLPLAAGYYILTKSYHYKFRTQRLDRNSLFFETVIIAVFILIAGFLLKFLLFKNFVPIHIQNEIMNMNPIKNTSHSGMVGISFLLVVALTHLTNYLFNKEQEIFNAIKSIGNELELMAAKSLKEERLVLITLKNNKVYIGWVKELPIPSLSSYLRIIPAISGFRDDDKKLKFTSHYMDAYSLFEDNNQNNDFDVVMPICEIVSISFFNQDLYDVLN